MGRPREHDEDTRLALLESAERLVDAQGPSALSVRAVAEEAATTTRAVYSLFGSKAGLLEELAARLFQVLAARIDAVPRTPDAIADVVTASIDGFRQVALEHPALYRLVFLGVVPDLELGPTFAEQAAAAFSRLEALIARVAAERGLGDHEVGDAAQAVHALTEGLATIELRGGLGSDDQALALWRSSIEALVVGFAAVKSSAAQRLVTG
jgi:AcrR family transcriptional regulator